MANLVHPMHLFDDTIGVSDCATGPRMEPRWSPYESNGGTVIGVARKDSSILVADTRLSRGYSVLDRDTPKWEKLTDKVVIGTAGQRSETTYLHKILKGRIAQYAFDHRKDPSVSAIAAMLSTILYYRRFFPIYTFNIIVGVDDTGAGKVYSYDAVGSYDSVSHSVEGGAAQMIIPTLDSFLIKYHQNVPMAEMSKDETTKMVVDALVAATERDITTGDYADIIVIDSEGIHVSRKNLRQD